VVKAFALFLTWVWNKVYNGIEVHNFDRVTAVAPGHGVIYVPCHRSHADYLLLSYIIFTRGLMVPHIAAGSNLNLPLVGSILRRSGAFFLRRKIKGDPLYAAVFEEYLHLMIDRGFPIEYFIEGTRSRSGRTLTPKAGILAMTVQSFVRSHARPLVFVPVYIGYEKLMEGGSYIAELHGRPKKSESLLGLIRAARLLKRNFGRVHVNFGPPLALAEFLEAHHPDWRNDSPDAQAPWLRRCRGRNSDGTGATDKFPGGGQSGQSAGGDPAVHAQARGRRETAAKADRACPVPAGRIALRQLDRDLRHACQQR
jgi:glycerol-3-phosphate O-acyltransferase